MAYWEVRRLDKAMPLFEDVLKRREAKLGRDHPHTQLTVADLGVNYKDTGRLAEAIALLEEADRATAGSPSSAGLVLNSSMPASRPAGRPRPPRWPRI